MSERKFGIVVVGSGIAGLSAALSARQAGASVALVERATQAESGGNTRYTEAFLRMKSLDEPADDLADTILGDFMGYPDPGVAMETLRAREMWTAPAATLNVVDEQVVATLGERAGPTLRWLEGHGVKIAPLPTPFLRPRPRRASHRSAAVSPWSRRSPPRPRSSASRSSTGRRRAPSSRTPARSPDCAPSRRTGR